jgi:hypothetical protein
MELPDLKSAPSITLAIISPYIDKYKTTGAATIKKAVRKTEVMVEDLSKLSDKSFINPGFIMAKNKFTIAIMLIWQRL